MTAILFILLFVFLFSGIPVYIAMAFSSAIFMDMTSVNIGVEMLAQRMFAGVNKFSMIAIPCFIFAANVMKEGGLSKRIIDLANAMFGHKRGGLGIATVVACMFFGAVSGSSPGTVAAIGAIVYPALLESGYKKSFSIGLITSSAACALIIPPSIGMVVYGTVTGVSVGDMFIAGIIPGIIFGLVFAAYTKFYAHRDNLIPAPKASRKEVWVALKRSIWALGCPVIIIGGIYSGTFTPTESSAIAAAYAIIVAMLVYREMDFKKLIKTAYESAVGVAQIMILIAGATVMAWLLTRIQLPEKLGRLIIGITDSKFLILTLMNVILLIAGMFIDPTSTTLIFAPLFVPIAKVLGVDLVHLGIIMTVNAAIGMYTPPFGFNLFVASGVTKLPINKLMPGIMPFILVSLVTLAFITWIPELSTWLPSMMR